MPPAKPAAAASRSPGRRPKYVVDPTPAPGGLWFVAGLSVIAAIASLWVGFRYMIDASLQSDAGDPYLTTLGISLGLLLVGAPLLFIAAWALVDGQRWSWMLWVLLAGVLAIGGLAYAFMGNNTLVLGIVLSLLGVGVLIYLLSGNVRDYFAPEEVRAKKPRKAAPAEEEDEEDEEE